MAIQNNVDVLTAQNNVKSAKSQYVKAKSDYFPQASIQNNAFVWNSKNVVTKARNGTSLVITENIYDGGLREASVQSSKQGINEKNSFYQRTLQTTVYNVSKAYYEALRARHLTEVQQVNVKYCEGLQDQVQARADVGDAAKVDILPIKAELANAQVSLLSAQNTERTTLLDLQTVLGISSSSDFNIKESEMPKSMDSPKLDPLIETALQIRPDVLQYKSAASASKATVKSARISLYPRPTISAQYDRQVSGGSTTGGAQLSGGIAFDIFNGGSNRAAYKIALANENSAELQEKQLYKDIKTQVEESYLDLSSSKERINATAVSLQASNENYDAQKEKYAQGLGTTLDLLNSELQLITAKSNEIEARYDYYIATAKLDYAVGKQGEGYAN